MTREKHLADQGTARIEQHAFADFIARGELIATCAGCAPATAHAATRWSRRSPTSCRRRGTQGIAAGLHVTVELPAGYDERAIQADASATRISSTR